MSQSESFLSRWSRRKTQSSEPTTISPAEPASSAAAEKPDRKETRPPALSEANESAAVDFDPASLPTIESISADADIRPFLQPGVPAELTRAALRRAWATDPAIRDFIEIAENQWDFNDPTAMPGFGPLTAADKAAILAAQMLAGGRCRLAKITDVSISATPASSEAGSAKVGQPMGLATRGPPAKGAAGAEAAGLATEQDGGAVLAERDSAPDARGNRRSHGRALPK